jgi:mannose-1-phosphate guanylyltransferase
VEASSQSAESLTIVPVVMAGGSGSRLWPMSRTLHPKQFLQLHGDNTMLQQTVTRLDGLTSEKPLVICNEEHRFIVAEQLRALDQLGPVVLEPVGRNTAPAVALAALQIAQEQPEALMLILAADHVIQDVAAFQASATKAASAAGDGKLVTFGIVPDKPETGYGYICKGDQSGEAIWSVEQFVEKPDLATAESYLASGNYLWNSGMFLFRADAYLNELEAHRPDILEACRKAMAHVEPDLDFVRVDQAAFEACPDDSIDYAVMEKTKDAVVVPMDAQWSDVGSWASLWDVEQKDAAGNVLNGDVIAIDTQDCLVTTEEKLVATVGLKDLVIVDTKDALLVAHKDQSQQVKKVIAQLKESGRNEHYIHREVYRPWGKYDSIDSGHRYQVKRITVKPGEKLSTQMHHHRAEHWIVVSGTAQVRIGEKTQLLAENQSVYIPLGEVHFLENPGKVPLELIEVQSGSYLGEDDIVRFEDRYGRVNV